MPILIVVLAVLAGLALWRLLYLYFRYEKLAKEKRDLEAELAHERSVAVRLDRIRAMIDQVKREAED